MDIDQYIVLDRYLIQQAITEQIGWIALQRKTSRRMKRIQQKTIYIHNVFQKMTDRYMHAEHSELFFLYLPYTSISSIGIDIFFYIPYLPRNAQLLCWCNVPDGSCNGWVGTIWIIKYIVVWIYKNDIQKCTVTL